MHRVEPKVYLVGESQLHEEEVERYLHETYGEAGEGWFDENIEGNHNATSGSELITEVMGRLCYRSFAPELNKNVKKIREGNDTYIKHILDVGHGSVIEHGSTNWIIRDVSRVFTHEMVRHRAGCAYSQESLRYVRTDDLGLWLPEDPILTPERIKKCEDKFKFDEMWAAEFARDLGLDEPGVNFDYKKKWTSFIRRFLPQGMATSIGVTINFRALRHVLEMRTAEGAEVEIRVVFHEIALEAKGRWPNLFQDFAPNEKGEWVPKNSKV